MARKSRIHFPGAVYHVILSGSDEQSVFGSAADRRYWETLVHDGVERFGHSIHGYCWSKGNIHMAVQVKDSPLSKVMQNLTFRYTRYFNGTYCRKGPLFKGRYKALVIDAETYLTDLVGYIHNYPVRVGQSKCPTKARWTSHSAYLEPAKQPDWLTTSEVLKTFGKCEKTARKSFNNFVNDARHKCERPELVKGSHGGRILGDEKFARKALKPVKRSAKPVTLNQLVKRVCRVEGVSEAELATESRARTQSQIRQTITYIATELEVASLTDMANRFNRDLTTMSRNQRYYRDRLAQDNDLQRHVRKVKRQVLSG